MNSLKRRWLLCLLPVMLIPAGCETSGDCYCTEVFVIQTVRVTDSQEAPITGVDLTITFADSGTPVSCDGYQDRGDGTYCILTDQYVKQLDTESRPVQVVFEKPGFFSRMEIYHFNTDPCQCHINLVSGDTTVVLTRW